MRPAATILLKDLRLRLRDRSVLIYGFVAPFLLALVFGLVFADIDDPVQLTVVVTGGQEAALTEPLVDGVLPALTDDGLVEATTRVDDRDAAVAAIEGGEADVGFVVLPDAATGPGGIEVLSSSDAPVAGAVATSIARDLVDDARVSVAAIEASQRLTAGAADPQEVVAAVLATPDVATTALVEAGTRPLDARTGIAVGMAVFFLLFAVGIASTGLLEEERDGTLARLRAAPIPAWSVLVAKALLGFVVGFVSLVLLAVGTTFAVGASWGSPAPLLVVIASGVLAAVGIVAVVASFARTPEAAANGTAIVATVAGLLGGSFFAIAEGPVLSVIAALTPHHWFLAAVEDVAGGAAGTEVALDVAVLAGMGIVTLAVAAVRFRRRLATA